MRINVTNFFVLLLLFSLINIGAPPVEAAELEVNGWRGTKTAYSQRTELGQIYSVNDMTENKFTQLRGQLQFEFLSKELDFNFGDGVFEDRRGKGGGPKADSVNIETNMKAEGSAPLVSTNNDGLNQSGTNTKNIDGFTYLSNNPSISNEVIIRGDRVYDRNLPFKGFLGDTKIGENLKLDGWGLYDFGTVNVENANDIGISGVALSLHARAEVGNTPFTIEGLYVSDSDKDTAKDFGFSNAGFYEAGANFYFKYGMMSLFMDDNERDYYSAYAYSVSNIYEDHFLGVPGVYGNTYLDPPTNFSDKIDLGAMLSIEKREVYENRYISTELDDALSYQVAPNVTIVLSGGYAPAGNFDEVFDVEVAAYSKGVQENNDSYDLISSYLELRINF